MHCSKSLGYLAYPLLTLFFLAGMTMQAQTTSDPAQNPTQSPDQTQSPSQPTPLTPSTAPPLPGDATPLTRDPLAQAQQQQGASSSSGPQTGYPNEQERIRLAREAQERVRVRREQRTQAVIQDTYSHKYDIYFGYAYLHMRPGHDLQHANENGVNIGLTRYFNQKWGLTVDFRGFYKSVYTGMVRSAIPEGCEGTADIRCPDTSHNQLFGYTQGGFQPFISNYSVMAGGQYSVRRRKNYAVGFQALAGVTYNLFNSTSAGTPGYYVGLYNNGTRFTAAATMPVDINLGPGLSVRIAPDYNLTTWDYQFDTAVPITTGTTTIYHLNHSSGTDLQHNLGFTIGLNYRLGRQ